MKKSELKALIREVIEETTSFKRGDKVWWHANDAFKTKRRGEVLTVSKGDVSLKDLDTGTTFVAKTKDLTNFEDAIDKSAVHQEMLKAQRELNNLLTYTRNGESLSGSYVEDWKKVAELRKNIQALLAMLKTPKQ